jgi:hypothetical protein
MVNAGTITSSPADTPDAASAKWSAAVPLEQATANRHPIAAANASSNLGTKPPPDEIQLSFTHSLT